MASVPRSRKVLRARALDALAVGQGWSHSGGKGRQGYTAFSPLYRLVHGRAEYRGWHGVAKPQAVTPLTVMPCLSLPCSLLSTNSHWTAVQEKRLPAPVAPTTRRRSMTIRATTIVAHEPDL